jgi:DNA-binding NarL/FixJ family response regulator
VESVAVLVLEPDPWHKLGFAHVLQNQPDVKLLDGGDYNRIIALRSVPTDLQPNVVMVSDTLLVEFNLALLHKVKELFPGANTLVHGDEGNVDRVAEILIAGAKGYFLLSGQPENLLESLKFVSKGLIWGPPEAIARSLGRLISLKDTKPTTTRADLITPRERTLINLLGKGLSNKEIANTLGIAEVTVKFHFAKLYDKFNVQSRLQLLTFAFNRGLISGSKNMRSESLVDLQAFKRDGRQLGHSARGVLIQRRRRPATSPA